MTAPPVSPALAQRIRLAARILRWSMAVMVVAALLVWYASSRNALALLRIALLTGTAAFIVSVVCFAWFALQSARLRAQR